uniref:ORF67 protein n=1 Tax=Plutella xylostella granulovirus TaxID=98383 RepID=A0A7U3W5U0_9BBAC|nr:ORF67 protein [Plutella xylostella granulovirus]
MSLDGGPSVAQNEPIHAMFDIFTEFRQTRNYTGLIQYLITNYPKNVKNRTFNFTNAGHTFHLLYAYIPSVSSKERKQIRLDCIAKLIQNTSNDHKLYVEIFELMGHKNKCPCEMISARLKEHINYTDNLLHKNFDIKPVKLKKEPIDNILFKYSINWKHSLRKRKVKSNESAVVKKKSVSRDINKLIIHEVIDGLAPTSLLSLNGATVDPCKHRFVTIEKQCRAGDEIVSFIRYCELCKITADRDDP